MQTRCQKMELAEAPDFGWPVKIQVRATTSPSAHPPSPDLPASSDFPVDVTAELHKGAAVEPAAQAAKPFTPDWRIFGEQDEGTEE
jgi:hypothetical protein